MKWNLRWVAARQDIWRPTQLLAAFQEVGFTPSLSKVSALWSNKPLTIRLDDLDMICTALNCTVADLMEAEQVDVIKQDEGERKAVGETGAGPTSAVRPVPKANSKGLRRPLPPN
ncbi:helix-turn-helix domain-containing protein [Streptomyces europaeiscabiei]|uniref:helix-turn-helix domain-containing protein n=1 Tax=Streptomyces europaeiscabiei TaxID=146819 RepID=UPI0029BE82A4|nr:helix-turn-helix transcriptional regulator [Streptomyces europaeiscabiei]MDX3615584.1 helix-turn-helix transcriptional regulator [Streptomyces europaeiscabiei]